MEFNLKWVWIEIISEAVLTHPCPDPNPRDSELLLSLKEIQARVQVSQVLKGIRMNTPSDNHDKRSSVIKNTLGK